MDYIKRAIMSLQDIWPTCPPISMPLPKATRFWRNNLGHQEKSKGEGAGGSPPALFRI